jgi:hypothetical protein
MPYQTAKSEAVDSFKFTPRLHEQYTRPSSSNFTFVLSVFFIQFGGGH